MLLMRLYYGGAVNYGINLITVLTLVSSTSLSLRIFFLNVLGIYHKT